MVPAIGTRFFQIISLISNIGFKDGQTLLVGSLVQDGEQYLKAPSNLSLLIVF